MKIVLNSILAFLNDRSKNATYKIVQLALQNSLLLNRQRTLIEFMNHRYETVLFVTVSDKRKVKRLPMQYCKKNF